MEHWQLVKQRNLAFKMIRRLKNPLLQPPAPFEGLLGLSLRHHRL
jgi:hypothetical protein